MATNQAENSPLPSALDAHNQCASSSIPEEVLENFSKDGGTGIGTTISSNMAGKSQKKTSSDNTSGFFSSFHAYRFQISLKHGLFTNELKNELLFDLNNFLYQLPADSSTSFIPSFNGHGLRFGKIWFSPENEESSDWLKQRLNEINEKR